MPPKSSAKSRGNGNVHNQGRGQGRGGHIGGNRGGHVSQPTKRDQDGIKVVKVAEPRPLPRGPNQASAQPSEETQASGGVISAQVQHGPNQTSAQASEETQASGGVISAQVQPEPNQTSAQRSQENQASGGVISAQVQPEPNQTSAQRSEETQASGGVIPAQVQPGPNQTSAQPNEETQASGGVISAQVQPGPKQDRIPVDESPETSKEKAANQKVSHVERSERTEHEIRGLNKIVNEREQPPETKSKNQEKADPLAKASVILPKNTSSDSGKEKSWDTVTRPGSSNPNRSGTCRGRGRGKIIREVLDQHQIGQVQTIESNESTVTGRRTSNSQVCDTGLSPTAYSQESLGMAEKNGEATTEQRSGHSAPSVQPAEPCIQQIAPVTRYLNRGIYGIIKKEKLAKLTEIKEKNRVEIDEIPLEDGTDPRVQLLFSCDSTSDPTSIRAAVDELYDVFQQTKREVKNLPAGYQLGPVKVYVHINSITMLQVQGIINAANGGLYHAGGVAKAIADTAGPELVKESRQVVRDNGCDFLTSDVIRTTSGKLPCDVVLHAVGPAWPNSYSKMSSANRREKEMGCVTLLGETFDNILMYSDLLGLRSIAVPPVSSGIFGVPHQHVVDQMTQSIMNFTKSQQETRLQEVHLVDISEELLQDINVMLRAEPSTSCLPLEDVLNVVVACCDESTRHEASAVTGCTLDDMPRSYLISKQSMSCESDRAPRGRPDVPKCGHNDKAHDQKRRADTSEEPLEMTFKKNCQIAPSEIDNRTEKPGGGRKGNRKSRSGTGTGKWTGNPSQSQATDKSTAAHPPGNHGAKSASPSDPQVNLSITINQKRNRNKGSSRTVQLPSQETGLDQRAHASKD